LSLDRMSCKSSDVSPPRVVEMIDDDLTVVRESCASRRGFSVVGKVGGDEKAAVAAAPAFRASTDDTPSVKTKKVNEKTLFRTLMMFNGIYR